MMLKFFFFFVLSTFLNSSQYLTLAFKITGVLGTVDPRSGLPPSRLEINQFAESGPGFDLYILALQEFQAVNQTDPLSYFQVAGIHGYPSIPWDGVTGRGPSAGYCIHTSVLFPIWHRPYLALFEQILWGHAQSIAASYPPQQRAQYQAAALNLRVPYWDWASNATLPDVLATPNIHVNGPSGWHEIANPLYQYTFHPGPEGNGFPSAYGLSRANFTLRYPNSVMTESTQKNVTLTMLNNAANIFSSTYQLLSVPMNYTEFSCTKPYGSWRTANSIENIHNGIHNYIGGNGHMYFPEFAAFDPAFWLHHAQVDRLFALWQALNPADYVVPEPNSVGSYFEIIGTVESIATPLAPFHSDDAGSMFTPQSARSTNVLGYTYPELSGLSGNLAQQLAMLRTKINRLYNPSPTTNRNGKADTTIKQAKSVAEAFDHVTLHAVQNLGVNNLETQWSIRVETDYFASDAPFEIGFFIGVVSEDPRNWATASNLIGTYGAFMAARYAATRAAGLTPVQGEISLTHTLAVGVSRGYLKNLSPHEVVPLLKDHLQWRAWGPDGVELCLDELSRLYITVQSRVVAPSLVTSEFPTYGTYETHIEATEGKVGGAKFNGVA